MATKFRLFLMSAVLFSFNASTQPVFEWATQLSNFSVQTVKDQVVDNEGNSYTVGEFAGTVDFDPSPATYNLSASGSSRDIYIVKLDENANLLWAVNIGNGNDEEVNDIALDEAGHIILTGTFLQSVDFDPGVGSTNLSSSSNSRTAFVLKLTTNSIFVWAKNPNWRTEGVGVAVAPNGDVYATLNTINAQAGQIINFPGPGSWNFASVSAEFFVWKLSSGNGGTIWIKEGEVGDTQPLPSRSIIVNGSNEVIVSGTFTGSSILDLGGFGGPNNIAGIGSRDGFVFKTNGNGNHIWHRTFLSNTSVRCNVIHYVDEASFVIGGHFTGSVNFNPPLASFSHTSAGSFDGFMVEMDYDNAVLNTYSFGGAGIEWVRAVSSDNQGGRFVAGRFTGTADFDGSADVFNLVSEGAEDAFLMKVSSDGDFSWALAYGSAGDEEMFAVSNQGTNIFCGGNFEGTIDFDHEVTVNNLTASGGGSDGYILKLNQPCVGGPLTPDVINLSDLTSECSVALPTAPTASNCLGAFTGTPDVTFPISIQGTTTITWTYDDGNGNTATQSQEVIIGDVTAPVADVASLTDVVAECAVTALTAPAATDNCAGAITGTHNATFPITATTTVTWTYDDGNGNTATQTQEVLIDDVTPPVANVASLTDVTAECTVAALTAPTATDNCAGAVTGTHNATLPITASTAITWTYDDGSGNTSSQTQEVIIDDVTAPVADVGTLADVVAECAVTALTAPAATDNCVGAVSGTHNATLPITASTTITWTYDDGNGNTSSQTQEVIIEDVTAPVADVGTLADVVAECAVTALTAPAATDNCAGAVSGTHNASLPITSSTTITWTYDDGNGNTSTQTQEVIIDDVTAPVADVGTLADVTAECAVAALTAPAATDNCVGAVSGTHNAILPITASTTITWTYDDGNGNTSNQTQEVIIDDVTAPVADATTLADLTDECIISSLTAPTATDNCTGFVMGTHNADLPITNQGTTTITWTYEDENGNTSIQTQNIVINDDTAPSSDMANLPVISAECEVTPAAPMATDNCAGAISGTPDVAFPITAEGTTTITWTYNDGNGNTTTQTQNVIIEDVTSPVPDVTNLSPISSECEVTSLESTSATDNCVGAVEGSHDVVFPITSSTTITWTYDDGNGNTSTQTQEVIITPIDNGITQIDAATLSADVPGYSYQWVDCNNSNQPIEGATEQTFTALDNGSYAVEISNGECVVTSECISLLTVSIGDDALPRVSVFPNPTDNAVTITSQNGFDRIRITNALGQMVFEQVNVAESSFLIELPEMAGVYFLMVEVDGVRQTTQVVKH